ncbi:MAG: winged helix-turn-helix domain-containing protein, partial [Bacteroidia bacterium]|nr:winged helix-turn-helix domain-containing protein [Bacteroidia bacterium]
MLHSGCRAEEISVYLGISEGTVWNYKKQYEQEGIEKYLEDNYKAYTGKLSKEQETELEEELERNLYHSSKEVVCWIQERWGIVYSLEGCVKLLHRLGFSYRKTKLFP